VCSSDLKIIKSS